MAKNTPGCKFAPRMQICTRVQIAHMNEALKKVHRDAISSDQIKKIRFRYFEMQLFDIFRPYNFTCSERASVENRLLSIESAIQWFKIHHGINYLCNYT